MKKRERRENMQAIKKQWFTLLLMIIQAVMIIFIQPEIGSVSLCNLCLLQFLQMTREMYS